MGDSEYLICKIEPLDEGEREAVEKSMRVTAAEAMRVFLDSEGRLSELNENNERAGEVVSLRVRSAVRGRFGLPLFGHRFRE